LDDLQHRRRPLGSTRYRAIANYRCYDSVTRPVERTGRSKADARARPAAHHDAPPANPVRDAGAVRAPQNPAPPWTWNRSGTYAPSSPPTRKPSSETSSTSST